MLQLQSNFAALGQAFSSPTLIQPLQQQKLVHHNASLANNLGIDFSNPETQAIFAGKQTVQNSVSMVYAGHQFGGFTPKLGDGRGVLLGEVIDKHGILHDLHMKGAGLTPYSRQGDGRAVLRSCIREYLASEAMKALNIPSSRALALYDSNEWIYREQPEKAAMLLRSAKTHIRFGNFEYFFYRQQHDELNALIQYCLETYFPECQEAEQPLIAMLQQIVGRTAMMIAKWQAIGFQHGVMNTDNMSILGETIDYGPYEFMDDYQPQKIFNHSDYEGRYTFERQPGVALWNLNCLMRCFSGHLERQQLVDILAEYETKLITYYHEEMRAKLGLLETQQLDNALLADLFEWLEKESLDYTLFFRTLSQMPSTETAHEFMANTFTNSEAMAAWLNRYLTQRQNEQDWQSTNIAMCQVNPKYILRNYLAQTAIEHAEQGDFSYFQRLLHVLEQPYSELSGYEAFAQLPPDWSKNLTMSCSS